ncbi:unnamed protein product [Malus baccata var. baccata]
MNYLIWNCRGLGSDTVVQALCGLIRKHRPSMIFLSETKMKDHRIDGIRRRMGYSLGFNVSPVGRAGGLSLWWHESLNVIILFSSAHIIDVCFCLEDDRSWVRSTFVYGTLYRKEKMDFWNWMTNFFGDFNEFMWDHEKTGGASVLYNRPGYLNNFLTAANLMDLGFIGPKFTWRGMRYGHLVEERLDRAAVNYLWQNLWPNSLVFHKTMIGSDHCLIVVQSQPSARKGKRFFLFEAFWAKEEECREFGEKFDTWHHKLSVCKSHLINWSRNKFKKQGLEIEELVHHLDLLQLHWEDNVEEIKFVTNRIDQLREQEELVNTIAKMNGEDGLWVDDGRRVFTLVEDRFQSLFTYVGSRDWGDTLNCIEPMVSDLMNADLIKHVADDEIKATIHQMGGLKAPAPDGFQGIFYHSLWDIIVAEIFSKVLANRLKPLMPQLISPMQNDFIADRQIQENLGLAHELFHFFKLRKAKQKFELCIKLDMHKAYNRAEYDFLKAVLLKLGFCRDWTNLAMNCRGVDDGRLNGIRMNHLGPCISHLFFANDTLIYLQTNQRNCENILHILNKYCLASGQQMSLNKSYVYFGRNAPAQVRSQLGSILGMPTVSDPGMYLGLLAIWGKSKRNSLAFVKGREVLLKAVVQAIPTYPMNLFKFSVTVCKDLDSLSAGFLWGDDGEHRRIHWVNWDTLGRPKCEGGLGFRNFQDFNDALLVKQCWHLILNPTSLWAQTLKARCFPHSSFLDAKDTRLWVDRWLPSLPLGHPTSRSPTNVTLNTKVSSLICLMVFAEVMALLKGCELAAELGFRWIVAESDSLEVVSSLQGDISNGNWEVIPILKSTLRLGNSFQGCRWSWVPKLANQLADCLASRTNLEMCGKTWVGRPLSSLVHILNKDGLPCPL